MKVMFCFMKDVSEVSVVSEKCVLVKMFSGNRGFGIWCWLCMKVVLVSSVISV